MDDVVSGARDFDSAFNLYQDSKEMFKEGGFNLRKFVTNDASLQTVIDQLESNVTTVCWVGG